MSKSRAYDPPQWADANRAKPRRATWDDFPEPEMDGDPTILVSTEQLTQLRAARGWVDPTSHGAAVIERSRQRAEEDARWKRWAEADREDRDRWAM